jgi:hypothetical protein
VATGSRAVSDRSLQQTSSFYIFFDYFLSRKRAFFFTSLGVFWCEVTRDAVVVAHHLPNPLQQQRNA